MTDPVVVVATFFPRAGQHDAVHALIAAAQTDVHQENGCLLYSLHETDDRFVLIEKWASANDLAIHSETERLGKLVEDLTPFLDRDIEIISMAPVKHPSGHAAGAL